MKKVIGIGTAFVLMLSMGTSALAANQSSYAAGSSGCLIRSVAPCAIWRHHGYNGHNGCQGACSDYGHHLMNCVDGLCTAFWGANGTYGQTETIQGVEVPVQAPAEAPAQAPVQAPAAAATPPAQAPAEIPVEDGAYSQPGYGDYPSENSGSGYYGGNYGGHHQEWNYGAGCGNYGNYGSGCHGRRHGGHH